MFRRLCYTAQRTQDQFMNILQEHFINEIDFSQNYIYRNKNGKRISRKFVYINIDEDGKSPRKIFNGKNIVFASQGASRDFVGSLARKPSQIQSHYYIEEIYNTIILFI